MGTSVVGIVLIVIGVVALAAGIAGGIAKMCAELKKSVTQPNARSVIDFPTGLLETLTRFLEALVKAPTWLALTIIGILLIAWGGSML